MCGVCMVKMFCAVQFTVYTLHCIKLYWKQQKNPQNPNLSYKYPPPTFKSYSRSKIVLRMSVCNTQGNEPPHWRGKLMTLFMFVSAVGAKGLVCWATLHCNSLIPHLNRKVPWEKQLWPLPKLGTHPKYVLLDMITIVFRNRTCIFLWPP